MLIIHLPLKLCVRGNEGQVVGKGVEDNSWVIQHDGEEFTITFENGIIWKNPLIAIDESPRDMVLFHNRPGNLEVPTEFDEPRMTVINRIDVCTRCEIEFTRDNTIYSSYSCPGTHQDITFFGLYEQHLPQLKISHSCEHSSPTICRKCWHCDGCATYFQERVDEHKKEHAPVEIDWDDHEPYGWKR